MPVILHFSSFIDETFENNVSWKQLSEQRYDRNSLAVFTMVLLELQFNSEKWNKNE